MFTLALRGQKSFWASCAVKPKDLFVLGVFGRPFFSQNLGLSYGSTLLLRHVLYWFWLFFRCLFGVVMKSLFLVLLFIFSANTYAAYYYRSPMDTATNYSAAELACEAYLKSYNPSISKKFTRWANADGSDPNVTGAGYCYYQSVKADGGFGTETRASSPVRRYGEVSICNLTNSPAAIVSRGPYGPVIVTQDGEKYILAPSPASVCSGTCLYEKPPQSNTKDCYLVTGETQTGFCNYGFTLVTDDNGDGTQCSTSTVIPNEIGDEFNATEPADPCKTDPTGEGCGDSGGGTGGGDTGDGDGGDDGNTGGGDGSGTGGDGSGDGSDTGDGGSGDGSGSGDGGSDSGSGGDGGSTPGDSAFTSPGALNLSVDSAQRELEAKQKYSGFKQELDNTETFRSISTAFSGSNPHEAAACPVGSVTLFGQNIIFDSHCDLFASIRPILSAVFIALWSLLAVRIVLSA